MKHKKQDNLLRETIPFKTKLKISFKAFFRNLFRSKRKIRIKFGEIDPNASTLTFNVINNSETDIVTARLFGSVEDLFDKKQSEFISISILESSHEEVKLQTLSDTFIIKGMKFCVKNFDQFKYSWAIYRKRMTGDIYKKTYEPIKNRTAYNNLANQVDAPDFELIVDKNTFIEIPLNPLEDITIIFCIDAEFNFFDSVKRSFNRIFRNNK